MKSVQRKNCHKNEKNHAVDDNSNSKYIRTCHIRFYHQICLIKTNSNSCRRMHAPEKNKRKIYLKWFCTQEIDWIANVLSFILVASWKVSRSSIFSIKFILALVLWSNQLHSKTERAIRNALLSVIYFFDLVESMLLLFFLFFLRFFALLFFSVQRVRKIETRSFQVNAHGLWIRYLQLCVELFDGALFYSCFSSSYFCVAFCVARACQYNIGADFDNFFGTHFFFCVAVSIRLVVFK